MPDLFPTVGVTNAKYIDEVASDKVNYGKTVQFDFEKHEFVFQSLNKWFWLVTPYADATRAARIHARRCRPAPGGRNSPSRRPGNRAPGPARAWRKGSWARGSPGWG